MVSGMFQTGEAVTLKVDEENRALIGRNHSATHILHKGSENRSPELMLSRLAPL